MKRRVGVIGAGIMGTGVAHAFASGGHEVVLLDCDGEALEKAGLEIRKSCRLQKLLGSSAGDTDADALLSRIRLTTDYDPLVDVDFVVENVTEKWESKQTVWRTLDQVCPTSTTLAANTSAISITRFASLTRHPGRVVGIHFMNPVPLKPMVELIRGHHTTEEALDDARSILASIGKTAVLVNDAPGFVSNRVLMLTINEAAFLVQEGVASAEDVDRIFKGCFGHKMGPLETADMIGVDTILYSIEVLQESFADSKYRPCPLLKKMVAAGLLGRKSGQGFFSYP